MSVVVDLLGLVGFLGRKVFWVQNQELGLVHNRALLIKVKVIMCIEKWRMKLYGNIEGVALVVGLVVLIALDEAVGRWGEGEKAFPLKKRRGSFEKRGNGYDDDDVDDTIIMEKDSNKKVQMINNKMKTKMNKKFVQQQQRQPPRNDNHEQDQENKESKDGIVPASVDGNNSNNNPSGAKKRGRGGALMEGSRCSRVNGRGWRCCQQTLVGYSLCEHHLGKGRLRSMTSVRSRSLAAKKEEEQQLPKNDDQDHQQQPLSNSSPSQQAKQITKRESLGEKGENGKEEEEDQKPLMMTKKRVKLGMVKARSISSLLGQNDNAIALAEDTN